jgi:FAD/FMN-containing dehydrogenase
MVACLLKKAAANTGIPMMASTLSLDPMEEIARRHGAAFAERGLGTENATTLATTRALEAIAVMRQIKNIFDLRGLLNPGKLLPASESKAD